MWYWISFPRVGVALGSCDVVGSRLGFLDGLNDDGFFEVEKVGTLLRVVLVG
jgi:hypothetical protein